MEREIETLLCEEIQSQLELLKGTDVNSEEYKKLVDGITRLTDKAVDLKKVSVEADETAQKMEFEREKFELEREKFEQEKAQNSADVELKIKQMEDSKKDRRIQNGIAIAGIAVPTFVTIWGTIKSIKFEQTGSITTIMGRGFINKLLPKK